MPARYYQNVSDFVQRCDQSFCNGDVHFFPFFEGDRREGSRLYREKKIIYWIIKKQEGLELFRLDISLHNTKEQEGEIPRWTRKSL